MGVYRIPCSWEMYGVMLIEAGSLEEAIEVAEDEGTELPDGDYIDGSFSVDNELIKMDGGKFFGEVT
jgi:hypothetical protein